MSSAEMQRERPAPENDLFQLVCNCISFVTNPDPKLIIANFQPQAAPSTQPISDLFLAGAEFASLVLLDPSYESPQLAKLCGLIQRDRHISSLTISCTRIQLQLAYQSVSVALMNTISLSSVTFDKVIIDQHSFRAIADALSCSSLRSISFLNSTPPMMDNDAIFRAVAKLSRTVREIAFVCNFMDSNGVSGLAESLSGLSELRELRLSFDNIGENGARALGRAFPKLHLTVIDLSDNWLEDEGVAEIVNGLLLCREKALRSLNLTGNHAEESGGMHIAKLIEASPCLTNLDISRNSIGEDAGLAVGKALANTQIRELNVSSCDLGPRGLPAVLARSIGIFCAARNGCGDAGAEAIASRLEGVLVLDLGENMISDSGAQALARGLSSTKCSSLSVFSLEHNSFGPAGACAILSAIISTANPPPISSLNLRDCKICDTGTRELARFISTRTSSLVSVCAENCGIGAAGAKDIAEALGEHDSVKRLNVSENPMGAAGACCIADGIIRRTKKMQKLSMVNIGMKIEGAAAIVCAIEARGGESGLREICLGDSDCEDYVRKALLGLKSRLSPAVEIKVVFS